MLPPGASTKNIENRVKDKTLNFVYLNKTSDEIEFDIKTNARKSEKQIKLLRFLEENDGLNISELEAITEVSKYNNEDIREKWIYSNYRRKGK